MARNEMGWLGWFCVADFVILAGLYVIAMVEPELWQFSMMWTGIIALLAGLGAIAFWFGDDPTAPEETASEPRANKASSSTTSIPIGCGPSQRVISA